ncbi:MAG: hypothetical protein WBV73_12500 [Phormidium sp.]
MKIKGIKRGKAIALPQLPALSVNYLQGLGIIAIVIPPIAPKNASTRELK